MLLVKPDECRPCRLWNDGVGFSRPEGLKCFLPASTGVLAVGEALGRSERNDGAPFRPYADAGSVLANAVRLAGLQPEQIAKWNVVACQPGYMERGQFVPTNELEGAEYEESAIEHCRAHFDRVVSEYKPRCLLALGNTALKALTAWGGTKRTVTHVRGFVLWSERYGLPVVATYHPSYLRRGPMNLFGVLLRDLKLAVQVARQPIERPPVDYTCYPSHDDALAFARRVAESDRGLLTYDIETREIAGQEEDDLEWYDKEITQCQFSLAPRTGIVFPWMEPYVGIARDILAQPLRKLGMNNFEFDDPILHAQGIPLMGRSEIEDLRWVWHHVQPDVPGKAHKGGLQYVTSFYAPEMEPWKHTFANDLATYGCADVDAPQRVAAHVFNDMRTHKIERGYERHVRRLRPILVRMSERGIGLDREAQDKFRGELRTQMRAAFDEMQTLVPDDEKNCLPKEGYKNDKIAQKAIDKGKLDEGEKWGRRIFPSHLTDSSDIAGGAADVSGDAVCGRKREPIGPERVDRVVDAGTNCVERWVRLQPFKPSNAQLTAYIKRRGHKMPRIPGENKETTGKLGLERLYRQTRHPLYKHVLEYRETEKMLGTYVDGWRCGEDGRVHTTFTFAPATGQLSSRNPCVQNSPRRTNLAKVFRDIIVPAPKHKLVSFDYKSFHVLTLGFEARDSDYMRAARTDFHSIIAATQMLKVEPFDTLWALSDEELVARLKWWRKHEGRTWEIAGGPKTFGWVRDFQAKSAALGYGFGLGARKMHEMYIEAFPTERDAKQVIDAIDGTFPRTATFRREICGLAQKQKFLRSRHGYIRWFWDVMSWDAKTRRWRMGGDAQKAMAFFAANDAFGEKKEAMLECAVRGWDERYWLVNEVHDDLVFDCEDGLVEECVANVGALMEQPSAVLVDAEVAPGGLVCAVEAKVGKSWGEMKEVKR